MRIVVRRLTTPPDADRMTAEGVKTTEPAVLAEAQLGREIELLVRLFVDDPEWIEGPEQHAGLEDATAPADLTIGYFLGVRGEEALAQVVLTDALGKTIRHEAARPLVQISSRVRNTGPDETGNGPAGSEQHASWPEAVEELREAALPHETESVPAPAVAHETSWKVWKRPLQVALLEALSQWAGTRPPWGVLTGVRPVKLVHRYVEQGWSEEQVAALLAEEYLLAPEKIQLMTRIVRRQRAVIPDLYDLGREVSVYVGIPFCPTKCAYCTFPAYSIQGRDGSVAAFLQALHEEIARVGAWLQEHGFGVTTVYVGGGTPTSITAEQLDELLAHLARHLPDRARWREWTVEAGRPDTITPEKLDVMKKWQVDRISINPQSFTQATLEAIGRHHTIEETLEAYELARRMGMANINMDLIIGLPGEGMATFLHSLEQVQRLKPESVTVHTLSFKRASAMTQNKTRYPVAGRDEVSEMVRWSQAWADANGYVPYYLYRQKNILGNQENVGYALPGKECLYNILIMEERQTILGLGCGAVSKIVAPSGKITRYANPKEPNHYNRHYREYIEGKLKHLEEQLLAPV